MSRRRRRASWPSWPWPCAPIWTPSTAPARSRWRRAAGPSGRAGAPSGRCTGWSSPGRRRSPPRPRRPCGRPRSRWRPHPAVGFAGFVHDAEKEYAEAVLTAALVGNRALPGPAEVGVGIPAWLNGLAEAASELRRHLLDRLRDGQLEVAERLLGDMEDAYDLLVTIDYPDAVTRAAADGRRTAGRPRADPQRPHHHHPAGPFASRPRLVDSTQKEVEERGRLR